jgi:hypothetical protein
MGHARIEEAMPEKTVNHPQMSAKLEKASQTADFNDGARVPLEPEGAR